MKNRLIFFFLFLSTCLFSQEKETVVIKKASCKLYQGVLAETKSWFLLVDTENNYYLANINKPIDEVYDWFVRFKDSQNIYKSTSLSGFNTNKIGGNKLSTLHFKKENEPGEVLNFYIETPSKDSIILISLSDNSIFTFQNIQ
jgi:hypothetical protein